MILPIVKYPDLRLNMPSLPVFGSEDGKQLIQHLIPSMFETMDSVGGIGLSAVQVGITTRVFVMDTSKTGYPKSVGRKVFVNPEILSVCTHRRVQSLEGCLSFPGVSIMVSRPNNLQIQACDENFEEFTLDLSGIDAICFQHELDHLNGITFDKYASERSVA